MKKVKEKTPHAKTLSRKESKITWRLCALAWDKSHAQDTTSPPYRQTKSSRPFWACGFWWMALYWECLSAWI